MNMVLELPSVANYYITASYCRTISDFGCRDVNVCITEIVLELLLGAIILEGGLSDFRTVISGELVLWENKFQAP